MEKCYRSWKALKNQLEELLCAELKGHVTYFLTRYHRVHNSYGRAAILFDGKELVRFSWVEMYERENGLSKLYAEERYTEENISGLEKSWDENGVYSDNDFLGAALEFTDMPIIEALQSENSIIKLLALMDRRVGKRTLQGLNSDAFPEWAKPFYDLRVNEMKKVTDVGRTIKT